MRKKENKKERIRKTKVHDACIVVDLVGEKEHPWTK